MLSPQLSNSKTVGPSNCSGASGWQIANSLGIEGSVKVGFRGKELGVKVGKVSQA